MANNVLLISFTDQSKSFTNGVELGRLIEKMQRGDDVVKNNGFPVRIENKQVLIDCCKAYGYISIFGIKYYGEWIDFIAIKKTTSEN